MRKSQRMEKKREKKKKYNFETDTKGEMIYSSNAVRGFFFFFLGIKYKNSRFLSSFAHSARDFVFFLRFMLFLFICFLLDHASLLHDYAFLLWLRYESVLLVCISLDAAVSVYGYAYCCVRLLPFLVRAYICFVRTEATKTRLA